MKAPGHVEQRPYLWRYLCLSLLLVSFFSRPCFAGFTWQDRAPKAGFIYIPPHIAVASDGPPELDIPAIHKGLSSQMKGEIKAEAIHSIFQSRLWQEFQTRGNSNTGIKHCGSKEGFNGTFVKETTDKLRRALLEGESFPEYQSELPEDLRDQFRTLLEYFDCEESDVPLNADTLRQLFLIPGLHYYQVGDQRGTEKEYYAKVFALGQAADDVPLSSGLSGEFSPENEKTVWREYSLAYADFPQKHNRIPVTLRRHRLASDRIRVDGTALTADQLGGEPLRLYPGIHFIQAQTSRKTWRSAIIEVPPDVKDFSVELGTRVNNRDVLLPRPEDADELLYRAMTRDLTTLPDWLREGIQNWLKEAHYQKLYVVVPVNDRDLSPENPLLIAEYQRGTLVDIDPDLQRNGRYVPLRGKEEENFRPYQTLWFSPGLGWSMVQGQAQVALSLMGRKRFRDKFWGTVSLDLQHHGFTATGAGSMPGFFLGVQRAPESPALDWVAGAAIGMVSPGWIPQDIEGADARPLLLMAPQLYAGVDLPLKEVSVGDLNKRPRRVNVLRGLLSFSVWDGMDQLQVPDLARTGWSLEAQLQFQWWWLARPGRNQDY